MAKIKTTRGYRFVKELGGAIRHAQPSDAAIWLVNSGRVSGRVLDYGCGHGFDADHFGWTGHDPYYRQEVLDGEYDTIVCNHVLNMLTRDSRAAVLRTMQSLLRDGGAGWLVVPRNIPAMGKFGARKRIQNFVVLDLPSVFAGGKYEIYQMSSGARVVDKTAEIESLL